MSISEHKHMSEPVRRLEIFTGSGRRRSWTSDEKALIVAESYGVGETVCSVARRHGLTPQQLFAWRRLAREATPAQPTTFVPALVADPVTDPPAVGSSAHRARRRSKSNDIELEIGGVAVRVGSNAAPRAIAAVIQALKASS